MTSPERPFLSRAAQLLSSSLAFADTLERTVGAALPELGDFGILDFVDGAAVRRTVRAHEAPDLQALLEPSQRLHPAHDELSLCALSTGEAAWHPSVDDAWYQAVAASPEQLAPLRALAFRSMLTVPMRYRGELVGALTLFMGRSDRRHTREQFETAQELAALAAPIVVNARLLAENQRARQRLELMSAASQRLAHSLDPEATLAAIAELLVPAVADWCRIDLIDAEGGLVRKVAYHADPERARQGLAAVQRLRASPETPGSMAWCARTGRSHTLNVESPEAFAASGDPALLEFARIVGMRAYSVTPLIARHQTLGALAALQAESGRRFDADDAALLAEFAQRAAMALSNARLYAQAEAARREAESASRAKDEFLAMLSHELRNPLAPIVTALRLMALQDPAAFRREREILERQVSHLSRLVDDLLDVARIARGDLRLRRATLSIVDVLHQAVEMATPLLEARQHVLRLHLPAPGPACDGDAARLAQVFANLLMNAARYTPQGGTIDLSVAEEEGGCRVTVRDNGQGIGAELLPRVFDLFFQAQQGLERSIGGLGVGLALVKTLVLLHGGRVEARSEGEGRGSEFSVWLPTVAAPASTPRPGLQATPLASRVAAPLRVLVVDDNRDAAESLGLVLELEGFRTCIATDPLDGLAQALRFSPQVAILDIGLPGMDGYELAARLRSQAQGLDCRMLALTGYGQAGDLARSHAAGFAAHLIKPVDTESLLRAVRGDAGAAG